MWDITSAVNLNCAFLKDLHIALGDHTAGVGAFARNLVVSSFQAKRTLTAIISRQ